MIPFLLLMVSLAAGVLLARAGGLDPTTGGRLGTVAVLSCPVFFSGILFARLLRSEDNVAGAMAVNLLGAMGGGLLEYNAMYFGFQFLYWLAAGLYLIAFLWALAHRRQALLPG